MDEVNEGIRVNGERVNDVRYNDGTVVLANNVSRLQKIVYRIVDVSESFGLSLNINNTKRMLVSKRANYNRTAV